MIGKTIGDYRIVERIGAGGMGVVYKAVDTRLDRPVALKFLPPYAAGEEETKRFLREAQAASAIDHPNICTVYQVGDDGEGNAFIAMAYYRGEPLDARLASGPLPIEEAVDIGRQAAEGLRKAHEQGVVHRDIKPGNLMITSDGLVKILDFGLAKVATSSKLTKSGVSLGTAGYFAPEQVVGGEVDLRCDIWALGVVLYEMLSGRQPFQGEYEPAIMYALVHQDPEPLRALRPEVPEQLERVVLRCLEKEAENRYQTTDELLEALRAPAVPQNSGAPPAAERAGPSESPRLRRLAIPAAVLAAAVVAVLFWRQAAGPGAPAETTVRQPESAEQAATEGQTVLDEPATADQEPPAVAPSALVPPPAAEPSAAIEAASSGPTDTPEIAPELQRLLDEGRAALARPTPQNLQRAIGSFRRAVELDSESPAAYGGLAEAVFWAGFWGYDAPERTWPRFTYMASNAMRLDPDDAEAKALAATGLALRDYNWPAAARLFESAVSGAGGSALAHGLHALGYLAPQDRLSEAQGQLRIAYDRDPERMAHFTLAGELYGSRAGQRRFFTRGPRNRSEPVDSFLRSMRSARGQRKKGEASVRPPVMVAAVALSMAREGRRDAAEQALRLLAERATKEHVSSIDLALLSAYLGRDGDALDALNKAADEHDPRIALLRTVPEFESLKSQPGWNELLAKLELAD